MQHHEDAEEIQDDEDDESEEERLESDGGSEEGAPHRSWSVRKRRSVSLPALAFPQSLSSLPLVRSRAMASGPGTECDQLQVLLHDLQLKSTPTLRIQWVVETHTLRRRRRRRNNSTLLGRLMAAAAAGGDRGAELGSRARARLPSAATVLPPCQRCTVQQPAAPSRGTGHGRHWPGAAPAGAGAERGT